MRGATDKIYLAVTQCHIGTIDREDQLDRYIKPLALEVSQFGCSQGREVGVRNQGWYREFHCIPSVRWHIASPNHPTPSIARANAVGGLDSSERPTAAVRL